MSVNIRALLEKKSDEKRKNNRLVLKDVNRDLIVSLLALPIYGKEARDEEILSIIINAGTASMQTTLSKIKDRFNARVKNKELKKGKDGFIHDKEGFIVLQPR